MSEGSLKKKYEEIVIDELYWVECRKCGFKRQSLILDWAKDSSCSRCGNSHTWLGDKVEQEKKE